jgi:tetratricopeptide (TPR) repeat protein
VNSRRLRHQFRTPLAKSRGSRWRYFPIPCALAAIPDYAPAHFELGLALQQQGKKDEARHEFQRANQLDAHFLAPADKY